MGCGSYVGGGNAFCREFPLLGRVFGTLGSMFGCGGCYGCSSECYMGDCYDSGCCPPYCASRGSGMGQVASRSQRLAQAKSNIAKDLSGSPVR